MHGTASLLLYWADNSSSSPQEDYVIGLHHSKTENSVGEIVEPHL